MNSFRAVLLISFGTMIFISPASSADGDASRGQRLFGACAACHSLEPNRNMTSPSLSNLWNRKAGSLSSFPRYSPALKSTDIVWDDKTLGEWLKDPQHFVPGNTMTFPGITNAQQRADLLAFLKDATRPGRTPPASAQRSDQMGGMMIRHRLPNNHDL
jgi:cytochrome c